MKIDLNKPILDLEGKKVGKSNIAKALAEGLSQQTDNANPLKVWEWCMDLHKKGYVELGLSDLDDFVNTVKTAKGFAVFFIGQVLSEISRQKK